MSTNAFDVKDNKNELIQAGGPLALEGNVIVFKAQEVCRCSLTVVDADVER